MTIRFAGARAQNSSPLRAWRCRSVKLCAANDNDALRLDETPVAAALRHFARHGLAAAELAAARARVAFQSGDIMSAADWLLICRQLDRRLADRVAATLPLCAHA